MHLLVPRFALVKACGESDNVAQLGFAKEKGISLYALDKEPYMDSGHIEYFLHGHRFVNRFPAKH